VGGGGGRGVVVASEGGWKNCRGFGCWGGGGGGHPVVLVQLTSSVVIRLS